MLITNTGVYSPYSIKMLYWFYSCFIAKVSPPFLLGKLESYFLYTLQSEQNYNNTGHSYITNLIK